MQKVDPNTIFKSTKVIYLDPIFNKYYYAIISELDKGCCVIYFPATGCYRSVVKGSPPITFPIYYAELNYDSLESFFEQLYYDNPENKTEALLNNITIY